MTRSSKGMAFLEAVLYGCGVTIRTLFGRNLRGVIQSLARSALNSTGTVLSGYAV